MTSNAPTLGTLLRTLVETLDGAVEAAYAREGLDYRARYTPIVRALREAPASIRAIADRSGLTHSAVSQTVAQMQRGGLVSLAPGADARTRIAALTPGARAMLPALDRIWADTEAAARSLDADLGLELAPLIERALAALDADPFAERIARAAAPTTLKESS